MIIQDFLMLDNERIEFWYPNTVSVVTEHLDTIKTPKNYSQPRCDKNISQYIDIVIRRKIKLSLLESPNLLSMLHTVCRIWTSYDSTIIIYMEIAIGNRFQLIDVNTSFSWTICIIDFSFGGADDA